MKFNNSIELHDELVLDFLNRIIGIKIIKSKIKFLLDNLRNLNSNQYHISSFRQLIS